MNPDTLMQFLNKKKADSPYISLADGESAQILTLKEIKTVLKAGFSGGEQEVLRLVCDVKTSEGTKEKTFENGSMKFAQEMVDKNIGVGASFTITRQGTGPKTKYLITPSGIVTTPSAE